MIDATSVGRFPSFRGIVVRVVGVESRAFEYVMPFEYIGFVGHGDDFGGGEGLFEEGVEFSCETFGGERGGHVWVVLSELSGVLLKVQFRKPGK